MRRIFFTALWDAQGIIRIKYLEQGKSITKHYYFASLDKFDEVLKEKRPHLKKKKIPFHHDNAPANSFLLTTEKLL